MTSLHVDLLLVDAITTVRRLGWPASPAVVDAYRFSCGTSDRRGSTTQRPAASAAGITVSRRDSRGATRSTMGGGPAIVGASSQNSASMARRDTSRGSSETLVTGGSVSCAAASVH